MLEKFFWRGKKKSIWRNSKWVCKCKDVIAPPTPPHQPHPYKKIEKNIDGQKHKHGRGVEPTRTARPLAGAATKNMGIIYIYNYGY